MQSFDNLNLNMMSAMIPMAQEFYLFIFFCMGFIVFRSDLLQGWLKRNSSQSKKEGVEGHSVSYHSLIRLREDFSANNFEAVLEGWALLEEYTVEALKLVVVALLKLDRPDDVGLFVAKTMANLPELRPSLLDIVEYIANPTDDLRKDACTVAFRDLFSEMQDELDAKSLGIMLETFAKGNDERRVRAIMSRMLSIGSPVNAQGYAKIVEAFLDKKNIDAALGFAQVMSKQQMTLSTALVLKLVQASIHADNSFAAEDDAESHAWTAFDALQDDNLPQDALVLFLEWAGQQMPVDMAMVNQVEGMLETPMPWPAYVALVRAHASPTGDSAKALTYFDELAAKACGGNGPSEGSLVGMLVACTEAKDARLAEHMLSWAQKNNKCTLPVFAAATKVLAEAKQFCKICTVYEAAVVDGLVLDDAAYGQLIKHAVQAGRVGLARSLFQKAKNPDMLNYMSLIRACGQEKNVQHALELLREMWEQGAVDTAAYNCVLDVCVVCNEVEAAKKVFEEMKQGNHLDVISYNTLLKLYVGEGGSWANVEALLEEMRLCGIKPNVATYNSLLGTALSSGDLRKAWQIVDMMESSGVGVDAYTCSILFKGFRAEGQTMDEYSVDRTLDLIRKYKVKVDEVLVNSTLEACVRLKDAKRLTGALSIFEATGWKLPAQCAMHTYGTLIKAYGQSRQLPMAWKLWREVTVDKHLTPSDQLYTTMIDVLVSNNRMEEALNLFEEMKARCEGNRGQNFSVTYATVIRGFAQRKECQRAMQCYQEMKEHNVKISVVVYNTLIDACCRVVDMEGAARLFQDMVTGQSTLPDLITYSTLIKGYCLCGDMDECMQLFMLMRKKGIVPDAVVFNSLLDGCAKRQMRTMCEQVLRDMEEAGIRPSNHTVSILVKLYGRCRDMGAAFRCFEDLPREHGFKANAAVYTCLMSACIANNQLDRALELKHQMNKERVVLDQKTYSTLLRGTLRVSNIEAAIDLIHSALDQRTRGLLEEELVQNILFLISRRGQVEQQGRPLVQRLRENGIEVSCPNEGVGASCGAQFGGFGKQPQTMRNTRVNGRGFHNRRQPTNVNN
jgi:pentatricopeptide repeat protein